MVEGGKNHPQVDQVLGRGACWKAKGARGGSASS